jgi:hypothetical protein
MIPGMKKHSTPEVAIRESRGLGTFPGQLMAVRAIITIKILVTPDTIQSQPTTFMCFSMKISSILCE